MRLRSRRPSGSTSRAAGALVVALLALSLVLLIATVASWLLSHRRAHAVSVVTGRRYSIVCDSGIVQFHRFVKTDVFRDDHGDPVVREVSLQDLTPREPRLHFKVPLYRMLYPSWPPVSTGEMLMGGQAPRSDGTVVNFGSTVEVLAVAHWLPAAVALVASGALAPFVLRRRAGWRLARGLCPACGYDLRASPDRCPECGRPSPATTQPTTARTAIA